MTLYLGLGFGAPFLGKHNLFIFDEIANNDDAVEVVIANFIVIMNNGTNHITIFFPLSQQVALGNCKL
jgi:hypothetical protein